MDKTYVCVTGFHLSAMQQFPGGKVQHGGQCTGETEARVSEVHGAVHVSQESSIAKLDDAAGCICTHELTAKGNNLSDVGTFELPLASTNESCGSRSDTNSPGGEEEDAKVVSIEVVVDLLVDGATPQEQLGLKGRPFDGFKENDPTNLHVTNETSGLASLDQHDVACATSVLLEKTCLRSYGEACNFEITNHCIPCFECDGSPRECTPGLIYDRERVRGKHKCTKYKGTARDCRGAEAIALCACCQCTGYTESVAFALYTRPPKRIFLCTGITSDTFLSQSECATHHEDYSAADLGDIFSQVKQSSLEEQHHEVPDKHGDGPKVSTGVEVACERPKVTDSDESTEQSETDTENILSKQKCKQTLKCTCTREGPCCLEVCFERTISDASFATLLDSCFSALPDGGCPVILDSNDSHCCATNCNNCSCNSPQSKILDATTCNEKCTSQELADVAPDNGCYGKFAIGVGNCVSKLSLETSKGKIGCPCQNSSGKCADHLGCLATAAGFCSKSH